MTHRFEFDRQPDVTPMMAELMLRRYGIPIMGRELGEYHEHGDGGQGDRVNRGQYGWFALEVPEARAGWAEYLLCRWGHPARSAWVNPANANVQPSPMPPEWGAPAQARTFMDHVLRILCAITGQRWDLQPQVRAKHRTQKRTKLGRTYS